MRWRTAHRNRRAQLGLVTPKPRPRKKRELFDISWRKWLKTLAPTFVSATVPGSLWERALIPPKVRQRLSPTIQSAMNGVGSVYYLSRYGWLRRASVPSVEN